AEDVRRRAGRERRASAFLGRDIARHRGDLHRVLPADFRRGRFERFAPAGRDHQPHAFAREREGAAAPESLRGGADQRRFAADAKIHVQLLFTETSSTPKITSTPPSACTAVKRSSSPSALVIATLTGPSAPISANSGAPMRFSASAWMKSGSTVVKVASRIT